MSIALELHEIYIRASVFGCLVVSSSQNFTISQQFKEVQELLRDKASGAALFLRYWALYIDGEVEKEYVG